MSLQKLLDKQRPHEYRDAAKEILVHAMSTTRSIYVAVQLGVAYGIILGKRMERERKKRHEAPAHQ